LNKQDLIVALADLPGAINFAEVTILEAQANVTKAKEALSTKEADLYSENKIDGKNAEIRAAQLRQLTTQDRLGRDAAPPGVVLPDADRIGIGGVDDQAQLMGRDAAIEARHPRPACLAAATRWRGGRRRLRG